MAVIATIVSRWWLSHHVDADAALRAVVALAPIPVWFMNMRSAEQRLRLVDEMQRLIFYKAWLFAGVGTIFVMIALWQVQLIGLHLPEWLSHANDEDTDDEAAWSLVVAQLKREFEIIEPLGGPDASLWSATIHDAEGGLLSLS